MMLVTNSLNLSFHADRFAACELRVGAGNEMTKPKILFVGGLVAMGFDATGQFLLTVTHSGRGVFTFGSWERVARDAELAYPEHGKAIGIGPIEGHVIDVAERDENRDQISLVTPDGRFNILGESDGITITETNFLGSGLYYLTLTCFSDNLSSWPVHFA